MTVAAEICNRTFHRGGNCNNLSETMFRLEKVVVAVDPVDQLVPLLSFPVSRLSADIGEVGWGQAITATQFSFRKTSFLVEEKTFLAISEPRR